MTRVLYWNVRNFSLPKVLRLDSFTNYVESQSRVRHIVREVISPQAPLPANPPPPPDMIVIVEVYSRTQEVSYQGNVLNQGGNMGRGVLWLLNEIRATLGNTWCVVPPLMVGDFGLREAVAVYYNAASLGFAGPYVWATANGVNLGRPAVQPNLGNLANYSQDWLDAMPNPNNPLAPLQLNRNWTANGVQVNEWQGAGQWEHHDANGRINFPNPGSRSPFYARMIDTTGRTIKVFAIHTSPASAVAATRNIAGIPDLAVGANEVGVVVGDFNVESFNMNVNGAYGPLLNLGYTMLLDPRDTNNLVNLARAPYCMTHVLPPSYATPFNATGVAPDPRHNVYPRFGYMGSTVPRQPGRTTDTASIDNAFVAYPHGTVAPNHNTTIVNTVVGKPYNAVNPAPAGVTAELTGGYGYNSSLAAPVPLPGGVNPTAGLGQFTDWNNFQRIDSVSDHLAMVFDV
jgi:hypothetical protein